MLIKDLGLMLYRSAWAQQEHVHADVVAGGEERILLVEHPPVITCGRRPNVAKNLLVTPEELARRGVEFIESDRGGDITFHGPGQLVAYPIIRLADHGLSVGGYVRRLEQAVIAALAELDITARKDACAVGVWVNAGNEDGIDNEDGNDNEANGNDIGDDGARALAKICAIGVRVRRGVSMHGIALNITTDLDFFKLIVPCGLSGRRVTSVAKILGASTPAMGRVKEILGHELCTALGPPGGNPDAPVTSTRQAC